VGGSQRQAETKTIKHTLTKMNAPKIATHLAISHRKACIVLAIIRGQLDPLKYPKHFPATDNWTRQCYHQPKAKDLKLSALNELLEMHGVEAIRDENAWDRYYGDCVAEYLNTGDSYAATILLDHERNKWTPTTYGDWVENRMDSATADCE
jgi:hypothetical protein